MVVDGVNVQPISTYVRAVDAPDAYIIIFLYPQLNAAYPSESLKNIVINAPAPSLLNEHS